MNRQSGQEPNGHIGYKHFRKLFKCLTGIRSGFKAYFICPELLSIPWLSSSMLFWYLLLFIPWLSSTMLFLRLVVIPSLWSSMLF